MDIRQTISKIGTLISSLKKQFPRGVAGDQSLETFDLVPDKDPVKALKQCDEWIRERMMDVKVMIVAQSGHKIRHWMSLWDRAYSYGELLMKTLQLTQLLPRELVGVQNGLTFDMSDFFEHPHRFIGKGDISVYNQSYDVSSHIWVDPQSINEFFEKTTYTETNNIPYIGPNVQDNEEPLPLVIWKLNTNPSQLENNFSNHIQSYLRTYVDSFRLLYPRQPIPIAIQNSMDVVSIVDTVSDFVRRFFEPQFPVLQQVPFVDQSGGDATEHQQKLDQVFSWLRPPSSELFDRTTIPVSLRDAMFQFYKNNMGVLENLQGRSVGTVTIRDGNAFEWNPSIFITQKFATFLNNCTNMKTSPKVDSFTVKTKLSENSYNGEVFRMTNDADELFIGKMAKVRTSDNPIYEFVNGVAVNELRKQWPFFVGTYDLYRREKNDDWVLVNDPFSLVSSDSTQLLVTSELLPSQMSMQDVRKSMMESAPKTQVIPFYVANTIMMHACLSTLSDRFLHQDHHDGNVLLIQVGEHSDDYVEVNLPGLEIPLRTSYWPVLIDFGRSYIVSASTSPSQQILRQVDNLECAPEACPELGFSGILKDRSTQVYPQVYQALPLLTMDRWWSEEILNKYLLEFLGLYRRIPETKHLDESDLSLAQDPTYMSLQEKRRRQMQ